MGMHEAVYHAPTNKIYGVVENYVVQFNADSGEAEANKKVCAPCYGPMRIYSDGTNVYISSINDWSVNGWITIAPDQTNKQIWTLNTSDLTVANNFHIDLDWQDYIVSDLDYSYWRFGPTIMHVVDGWICTLYAISDGYLFWRTNIADPNISSKSDLHTAGHTHCQGPDGWGWDGRNMFSPDQYQWELEWTRMTDPYTYHPWTNINWSPTTPGFPTSSVYVPSKGCPYALTGDGMMWRCDDWTYPRANTSFNLEAVYGNVRPFRLRLSPYDGLLYMACMVTDVIIAWNTASETGTYTTGYTSPIDVVFTPTKKFAVQTGPVPLKEMI